MYYFTLFLIFALYLPSVSPIGKCDLNSPPPSWLSTNGTGISDWATAGKPTNGSNFCIQGDFHAKTVEVDYHIDLGNDNFTSVSRPAYKMLDGQNGCVNNNSGVVYCFAICLNETMQYLVIESALKYNKPVDVARDIEKTVRSDWAIAVLQVDYNDPAAHLNASVFLVEDVWCSVYVGIRPKLGFDWLYEIQLGKIIE